MEEKYKTFEEMKDEFGESNEILELLDIYLDILKEVE